MKLKRGLSFLFFILGLGFLTYSCYQNRAYSWDMPGYLGCIYSWDFPNNPEKVHALTYSSIKEEATDSQYYEIVSSRFQNKIFEENTKAFSEQIPYYKIKVGYNAAIYLIYKLRFSGPLSVLLISIFSYFISGILLFYFLQYLFPQNYFIAPIISLLILWFPPIRDMAENPTPDLFSLVFLLLYTISVLQKRSYIIQFIILMCCVLVRPDYILFAGSCLFAHLVYTFLKENKRIDYSLVVQGLLLGSLYIFIITQNHYPGWKHLFYDSFIYRRPIISAEKPDFSLQEYGDILFIKLIYFKKVTLASLVLICLIFYFSKEVWIRILAIVFFLNVYFKFVFFPASGELRFFIGYDLILVLLLFYALSVKYERFNKLKKIP